MSGSTSPWRPSALAAALVVSLIAGAIIWYLQVKTDGSRPKVPTGVVGFIGGCQPFSVHAQNRWDPRGAALRVSPNRSANQIGGFDPNQLIPVNGWVRTQPAYPGNRPPFDNDIWFHVANNSGWVAFGAVRSDPTSYDPTGLDRDGGRPAPIDPTCSGSIR